MTMISEKFRLYDLPFTILPFAVLSPNGKL